MKKTIIIEFNSFHYVGILVLSKGPETLAQGHEFHNLGSVFHEYHNHGFSSSSLVVGENIFLV